MISHGREIMDSLIGVKTPNRQEQAAKRRHCMHMHIITPPRLQPVLSPGTNGNFGPDHNSSC
jgi:hypothetical protein